jgi:hypothetical protein
MVKRFNIALPKEDGGVEVHPMKKWLRQHPEHVPPGLDATLSTSHHLRHGLRRLGWSVEELADTVQLIKPTDADVRNEPLNTTTHKPESQVTRKEVTAEELGRWRRRLVRLLAALDGGGSEKQGVVARVGWLSRSGRIPREIAALMNVIAEMRNASEYQAKRCSKNESVAVRYAWMAVVEWVKATGIAVVADRDEAG